MYPVEISFMVNPKDLPRIQEIVKATDCRFIGRVTQDCRYISIGGSGPAVNEFSRRWNRMTTPISERVRKNSWLVKLFNRLRAWW